MILLFSLLQAALSVIVSVDLGSENMRVSMMKKGEPASIVLNHEGRRFTPAVASMLPISNDVPITITEEDVHLFKRYAGDLDMLIRYPMNSVRFLPELLGKNYSNKLVSYMLKRNLTMPFDADDDNYLELLLPPEFYASQLISKAVQDAKNVKVNTTVDDLALVVPKFLTHHQRKAFSNAGRLSTYKPLLIDSPQAFGTLFALERNQLYKDTPMIVAFVDIGASQTQVSVQEFTYTPKGTNIIELGYSYNDGLGSSAIDSVISRAIRKKLVSLKPEAEIDNKAITKMLQAGRKVKHELTLQPVVTMFLEDMVPGFDMEFTYTEEQLKKSLKRELKVLQEIFIDALHKAGLDEQDIDRVELIGGGSRAPILVSTINQTLNGTIPILRSLNAEEASAIGASYVVASVKTGFIAQDVKYNPYMLYHVEHDDGVFYYSKDDKLPIGIRRFIRAVDLGQKGLYDIRGPSVKVRGARKLSSSGLDRMKMSKLERILELFEKQEKFDAERQQRIHELDTFLIETRESLAQPEVMTIASEEERRRALQAIADAQYKLDTADEEQMKLLKSEVESATRMIIKRLRDKKELPSALDKLQETVERIGTIVSEEWPENGIKPKKDLVKSLGKLCYKMDKFVRNQRENPTATVDDVEIRDEKLKRAFQRVQDSVKERMQADL